MANLTVLLGAQWGDEGKGKWSNYLSKDAHIIARFQGGNNAGHTIYFEDEKFVLHQLPCGQNLKHQLLALTAGVVVNPTALVEEIAVLEKYTGSLKEDRLAISKNSFVITPWHIYMDQKHENSSSSPIGTTKKGIGPTYQDRIARTGLPFYQFIQKKAFDSWIEDMKKNSDDFTKFYEQSHDEWQRLKEAASFLSPFVKDTEHLIRNALTSSKNILLEGAQGALLDINHGTYPYVTSSSTIAASAANSIGFDPRKINKIYGIAKAYLTRVGEGPFPTEDNGPDGECLGEKGCEFGATTNRKRRCGWFDIPAMKYAHAINGFDGIFMNKVDILSGFSTIKVAHSYSHPQLGTITDFPKDPNILKECTPNYATLDGWDEDITSIKIFEDLPKNTKHFIKYLEKECELPICVLGTGPKSSHYITHNAFSCF